MRRIAISVSFTFLLLVNVFCESEKVEFKTGTGRREVVDKIVATVNGTIILRSDLEVSRIDLGGKRYTLEQAIDHELLFQKATARKLLPTALDVEKYILAWKREHNLVSMTDKEFEERLHTEGLTLKKYRSQLSRILAIRNLRGLEISEQVVVTTDEIKSYFKANPEYSDDEYLLQTKIVPAAQAETEADAIKKEKKIKWIELDWVKKSNLAEKMSFVNNMKVGEISKPLKVDQGYQFLKLVKKIDGHLETLDERYVKIERLLQDEKMAKFEAEYVAKLRAKASIVNL
jgi:parvulin-like peptidyl-prolyl isomerase